MNYFWDDRPDHLTPQIEADFGADGFYERYAKAQDLVTNRHSKAALVSLVAYLLKSEAKLDEHYDSKGDVEQDPYGAWFAIQNQVTEIERLRRTIDAAFKLGRIVGFLGEDEGLIEAFREECGPELLARVRTTLAKLEKPSPAP